MNHCLRCGRPTRSSHQKLADCPGTVRRSGNGLCVTCYGIGWRRGEKAPEKNPPTRVKMGPCVRCGVPRSAASQPLCRDCTSVLSRWEQRAWVA